MLHNLLYSHRMTSDVNLGFFIECVNRLTHSRNQATWYPPGKARAVDITYVDIDELLTFIDPVAALEWVNEENG